MYKDTSCTTYTKLKTYREKNNSIRQVIGLHVSDTQKDSLCSKWNFPAVFYANCTLPCIYPINITSSLLQPFHFWLKEFTEYLSYERS